MKYLTAPLCIALCLVALPAPASPGDEPEKQASSEGQVEIAPEAMPANDDDQDDDDAARYAALPPDPPPEINEIKAGRRLFLRKCKDCHGRNGGGDGPVSSFMDPRPRDLRRGVYKLRSTETGTLPTDWDLFRTVTRGVPGTSMPGWRGLSRADRWRIVGYIKSLSKRFVEEADEPRLPLQIQITTLESESAIERGSKVYDLMQCGTCHGETGRGDGPAAKSLRDERNRRIYPFDMTQRWKLKSGSSPRDLVRVFYTGLDGTPMPSYADTLTPEQASDLAFFVRSLSATN